MPSFQPQYVKIRQALERGVRLKRESGALTDTNADSLRVDINELRALVRKVVERLIEAGQFTPEEWGDAAVDGLTQEVQEYEKYLASRNIPVHLL